MTNPYAPPTARVDDVVTTTTEAAPRLWNPNAAVNWSLLFSPAFGAWLHMKNWQALGEPQKAKAAKTWVVMSLVFIVGLSVAAGLLPDSKALDAATRSFGLVLLVAWYIAAGRAQATLVFALVFVIAFAAGMAGAE